MSARRGRPRYEDLLTPREWEVIDLLEQGLTNEEIAARLGISFGGAKFHVAEILSKLGVNNRDEAVRIARLRGRRHGVIPGLFLGRYELSRSHLFFKVGFGAAGIVAVIILSVVIVAAWRGSTSGSNLPEQEWGQEDVDFRTGDSERSLAQAEFEDRACVSGALARNERNPNGLVMPTQMRFEAIEEAGAWLCMAIPRLRHPEYRILHDYGPGVFAFRSHDLEMMTDGKGHRRAEFRYQSISSPQAPFIRFEVWLGGLPQKTGHKREEPVIVQGVEGDLLWHIGSLDDGAMVVWEKYGYGFVALTRINSDFTLKEFLAVLETVR